MPTLTINGKDVEVDDSFLSLSPEEQNKTVDEIASQIGTPQNEVSDVPEGQDSQNLRSELSAMTQNPAKAIYDQRPGYQKAIQAAQDIPNILGDAVTFGFGDKAAAALRAPFTDKTYSQELETIRAGTNAARDRAGSAGLGADVLGSLAVPVGLAGKGITLTGRLGSAAATGAKGVAARAALLGAEGAGYGTLSAAGHDTSLGEGATLGAIGGGLGSVAGDVAGGVISKVSSALAKKPKIPDISKLREAEQAAYKAADDAGVIINPAGVQKLNQDVTQRLADFGYDPALQPRVAPVLQRLNTLSEGNVTLKGLHTLRKVANNARISQDRSERAAGGMVVDSIDNFLDNLSPSDVLAGDKLRGPSALKEAISLGRRVRKNEQLIESIKSAQLRAASTGSGGNIENATRQNVRKLVEKGKGFTADERAAMEEIVRGTPGQNLLRLAGKLSPQGNGLMAALGVGGAIVNPIFGAASLGGLASKALADRGVAQGVKALDELIRSGGNAQALRDAQGTLMRLTPEQRTSIARLFLGANVSAAGESDN